MASSKSTVSPPSPQPLPPPISAPTVGLMIQLCEYMFRSQGRFRDPLFDATKLSTVLFGMGFPRDFLSKCEWEYFWNFAALFPALYDGSFYGVGSYGQTRGQGDLRGFATFICGAFADTPMYRNELLVAFEQSRGMRPS